MVPEIHAAAQNRNRGTEECFRHAVCREVQQRSSFQVLPLRQFGNWGPEIATRFDPQKDTYVMVCTYFLLFTLSSIF